MQKRGRWAAGAAAAYLLLVNLTNVTPAYHYQGFDKQLRVALGLHHLWHPCATRHEFEGTVYHGSLPMHECFRMTEPQRMKGVWIDQFEGSRFLPGDSELKEARLDEPRVWLDAETNRIPRLFDPEPNGEFRVLEVDFIGRRTLFSGQYGHMGGSEHEVIVERLISARELDAEPWRRAVDAHWDRILGRGD